MKKRLLLLVLSSILLLSGCLNDTAKKLMNETRNAITNGDYEAASTYGELALKEGCKDEEFINLMSILKNFMEAREAVDNMDIDKAEDILGKVNDFDGSGMAVSLKYLKEDIEAIRERTEEYEDDITKLEESISKKLFYTSANKAKSLLDEDLTLSQRNKVQALLNEAESGKKEDKASSSSSVPQTTTAPTSQSPKAMLNTQEAIDVARKAMSAPANAKITAQLISNYYQINIETEHNVNGEIRTSESSCKVNALTGEVYDQFG